MWFWPVAFLFTLILLFTCRDARAHDQWADGTPVPSWVKGACCGPTDVHHLTPDQVHREGDNWRIDIWPGVIPASKVLPSQDGDYWAFFDASMMHCFFVPLSF